MKYALDKPGVLCVLPGIRSVSELDMLLDYENQILILSRERSA
jgi:hypothetical protein